MSDKTLSLSEQLPHYDISQTYLWNYRHAPTERYAGPVKPIAGDWDFCGLPVPSPLGVPAGPLLNGDWCLYYASLGFDVLTYKTVRSRSRECYPLPNLQPVLCDSLTGEETETAATEQPQSSWAVSFGMPSATPDVWREDVARTRRLLPAEKKLVVSVVGTIDADDTLDDLADDYARCGDWARQAGADAVELNFSCPNVSTCDGQLYQHAQDAARVASRVAETLSGAPLIIKIGHVPTAVDAKALLAALEPHASALAMTNSIATQVRTAKGQLLFDGQKRGICGAATLEGSLRQTEMFADLIAQAKSKIRLIGVGGAASASDVKQYLDAGAHHVQLATAAMLDPAVALKIRKNWR